MKKMKKKVKLSVICSNKRNTENHILRIEFLNILKNYFGDEILWFGNGFKILIQSLILYLIQNITLF